MNQFLKRIIFIKGLVSDSHMGTLAISIHACQHLHDRTSIPHVFQFKDNMSFLARVDSINLFGEVGHFEPVHLKSSVPCHPVHAALEIHCVLVVFIPRIVPMHKRLLAIWFIPLK